MNTTFTYGFAMAIASAVLNYVLYFLGYHDSVEKLQASQSIGSVAGMLIGITCITLAMRARRSETPVTEDFGYGRAFLTGFLTSLWATIFGAISHVIYMTVVNRNFHEIVVQGELAKLEAKGMSASAIEQAAGPIRFMTSPIMQGILAFIFGLIIWTIISAIIAAFVKRKGAVPPAVPQPV